MAASHDKSYQPVCPPADHAVSTRNFGGLLDQLAFLSTYAYV